MTARQLIIASFALITTVGSSMFGQDWHQWRGPNRDGSVIKFSAPEPWPSAPEIVWSVPVGEGYSSPVVSKGRVYLLARAADKETVRCMNLRTGEIIWQFDYTIEFMVNPYATRFGKGPFATPYIHQGRLFTVSVTGIVHCFDAKTGKVIWRYNFQGDLNDKRVLFCGNTVSPIVVGSHCIVHLGNESQGEMLALNIDTGKPKWKWRGDIPGYASPILAEIAGQHQLITLTQNKCVGIDPSTGKLLWQYPFKVQWRENIVNPVAFGDTVIISGREQDLIVALKIDHREGKWQVEPKWENDNLAMYLSSPVIHGDRLYGYSHKNKGSFFCLDARTGQVIWQGKGRQGESAALLNAGDFLFLLTTESKLSVLAMPADAFSPLRVYEVGKGPTWTIPAVVENQMIFKDGPNLTLLKF